MATYRPQKRDGGCYELAWNYLLCDERYKDGWCLVHGQTRGSGDRIPHAWLLNDRDQMVYDPIRDEHFAIAEYQRRFRSAEWEKYAPREAAFTMAKHRHYGPWLESPEELS